MAQAFSKQLYQEHVSLMAENGVTVPENLEKIYQKYIEEKMKDMPYADAAVTKMYTLVFFLKYTKQMEGKIKFKDIYSKLEMQKKLISRAMSNVEINFEEIEEDHPVFLEDWSSLYSIKIGIGADIQSVDRSID